MDQEEERSPTGAVYHTGDFEALSIGKDEENNVEYWFNPMLGIAEPFVGFTYTPSGPEPCAKTYPIEKGEGIPEIYVTESQEDGSTMVKVRQKTRQRRFVDYRVAIGLFFMPVLAWFIERLVKNQRKNK
jgi:hypothetical protein